MTKPEVREHAARLGLRTASKRDSQDICFVKTDYRSFLREHFDDVGVPGQIIDTDGVAVGEHNGTVDFTIGQRKGIGVAAPEPRYVVDIKPATATVVIGRKEDLEVEGCSLEEVSFVSGEMPPAGAALEVKVRYRADPVKAELRQTGGGYEVLFEKAQRAVAPGQAAVLYAGDEVVGGGTIGAVIR